MASPQAEFHRPRDDLAVCEAMIRTGSRSFHTASRLLPARVRQPALALYAFCREADDAIDHAQSQEEALADLQSRLDAAYAGRPRDGAVDRAFSRTVLEHQMPRELPEALLHGFAWDAARRRYETIVDLRAYAARVAGTVGAMMAVLMGVRSAHALARACDLGAAMQLTNIARDVGEDARAGRLYLPLSWLREEGIDADAFMRAPAFSPALARVVAHLLHEADRLYVRSASGIGLLPRDCRPAIHAARLLYAEIGREVARHGFDSVSRRAVVSGRRKLGTLILGLARALGPTSGQAAPCLPEASFLVDAAVREEPMRGLEGVIDLFERLERRDADRRALASHRSPGAVGAN